MLSTILSIEQQCEQKPAMISLDEIVDRFYSQQPPAHERTKCGTYLRGMARRLNGIVQVRRMTPQGRGFRAIYRISIDAERLEKL
jgi:hypothetical protein